MLKRFQILMEDWQEEYVRFISETYDFSFSESVRILLCIAMIEGVKQVCPDFKPGLTLEEMAKKGRELQQDQVEEEEIHKMLSKLYFEARKAAEVRLTLAKTQANKGKKQ